jgi:preprotein translocase subunit SecF
VEAEQDRLAAERKFREDMYESCGRTEATLTGITKMMAEHAREDRRQFRKTNRRISALEQRVGVVTQTVGENSNRYAIAWAVLGAAVTIFGIVWLFFEKVYAK